MNNKIDLTKVSDVELDGIHHWDAPDYVDAFISSCVYDGRVMTEEELELLNEDREFVYQCILNKIY